MVQGRPAKYTTNNSLDIEDKLLNKSFNLVRSGCIIVGHCRIWFSCLFN